jgi:DNA-binding XRE family transcriptional regulator
MLSLQKRRQGRPTTFQRRVVWRCGLKQRRNLLGLSLDDVAEAIGVCRTTVWQIENGTDPMLSTAARLAEFFGCGLDEMWAKP